MNEQLLADIDAAIKTNGNGAITGPILNNILKRIVGSNQFSFPPHSSLTTNDKGKLVMNMDGAACVANLTPGIEGSQGIWDISIPAIMVPPQTAEFNIKLSNSIVPTDGEQFTMFGQTFYFKNVAGGGTEITIGATPADTRANMVSIFTALASTESIFLWQYKETANTIGGWRFTIAAGTQFPGEKGNNAINFASGSAAITLLGQAQEGLNNDLDLVNDVMFEINYNNGFFNVSLGTVLKQSTAVDGFLSGGYRWPDSDNGTAANLLAALQADEGINNYFELSTVEADDTVYVRIEERNEPTNDTGTSTIISNPGTPVVYVVNGIQLSKIGTSDYISYPYLGVLASISSGIAKIDNGRVFKVKLAASSAPVSFDPGMPSNQDGRVLMGANNGEVTLLVPDDENVLQAGLFMALSEAMPGEEVWVESLFASK